MAKIKVKGKTGAAKNYITRNQALKKLQCSLSDFRRLCILKGIFPREPKNKKKANKGNTALTTFYYSKDIAYLLHEPVLHKLREHKAFAKKISRALGKGEFESAKSLQQSKPVYRLDHIIKERYPTFNDSLKDLSDVICLLALFAHLPANDKISPEIIENCTQLYTAWQLYVMKTQSLRKVFISIKGVYFEATVNGIDIRWLIPHMFTQHVPADIDFRIMLTFLDLYQTLMKFVLYKLYSDINLVYPPPIDAQKAEQAAGFDAYTLNKTESIKEDKESSESTTAPKVTVKMVKKTIKALSTADAPSEGAEKQDQLATSEPVETIETETEQEVFGVDDTLPTLASLESIKQADIAASNLLHSCVFFLSREVPRTTLEFTIRAFGGIVGWEASAGAGSPIKEDDPRITHFVIDRPTTPASFKGRVCVQPQWVIDTINAKQILPTQPYAPGQLLPPHLSPFVDNKAVEDAGGYVPASALGMSSANKGSEEEEEDSSNEESDDEIEGDADQPDNSDEEQEENVTLPIGKEQSRKSTTQKPTPALKAAAAIPTAANIHAAELEAESAGIDMNEFKKQLANERQKPENKNARKRKSSEKDNTEENLAKIMMSNKSRKLYDKMQYGRAKQLEEKNKLTARRENLAKKGKK